MRVGEHMNDLSTLMAPCSTRHYGTGSRQNAAYNIAILRMFRTAAKIVDRRELVAR